MEEHFLTCPHCWQKISVLVDLSLDGTHRFVEDCEVCCNPLDFRLEIRQQSVRELQADPAQ